jgi:hypothetical protein
VDRLTPKQERYCQERVKGLSQRQAYKVAFAPPTMGDLTIDAKASILEKTDKIRIRLKALQDDLAREVVWDKKRSLDALIGLYETAESNLERSSENGSFYIDSSLVNAGIKAFETINKMLGINAPDKIDIGTNDLQAIKISFSKPKADKTKDPAIVGEYTPKTDTTEKGG